MSDTVVATPAAAPAAPSPKPTPAAKPAAPKAETPRDFANRIRGSASVSADDFEDSSSPEVEEPDPVVEDDSEDVSSAPIGETEEEVSDEEEEVTEDWSWAQQLKAYKDGLHDIPLADLLQALQEGRLPDNLYKVLKVKLKDGDNEWEETIDVARNGAMMRRKFQQKTQALADERDAFFAERDQFVTMLDNWRNDPKALKAGLARLKLPFLEAAKLLAEEHRVLAGMDPVARQLYEEKQKAEEELARFKYEQEQAARAKKTQDAKSVEKQRIDFVSNTGAQFFQGMGIPMNKGTWGVFLRYFETETRANPGQAWNEDMVRNAVEATFEDYNALKAEIGGGVPAPAAAPAVKKTAQAAPPPSSPARAQATKAGVLGGQKLDGGKPPKPRPKGAITRAQFLERLQKKR